MGQESAGGVSRLDKLRELGFTDYQAKAYIALISLGTASATEVAAASAVPQAKVYGALKELETRGLVEADLGPPTRYRPVPLENYVRAFARDLRTRAETIEARAATLAADFRIVEEVEAEEVGKVSAVSGKRNILGRAYEAARTATKLLLISGTAPFADELAKGFVTVIREKTEEGVEVRVLLPIDADTIEQAKRIGRYAEVRHNPRPSSTFAVVVDDSVVILSHARVTGEKALRGKDRALIVKDRALVGFASEAILRSWHAATPLTDRSAELDGKEAHVLDVLRDPEEALAAVRSLVSGAEISLDIMTTELGAFQLLGLKGTLSAARKRGVRIRLIMPAQTFNSRALAPLAGLAELRTLDEVTARVMVADGRRAMLVDPARGRDSPFLEAAAFGPHTLQGTSSSLVGVLAGSFEAAWPRAKAAILDR